MKPLVIIPALIFRLLLFFYPFSVCADPLPSTLLPVADYVRGTAGEPLFVEDTDLPGRFKFRLVNETRYSMFNKYWDTEHRKQDLDIESYSRFTNFLQFNFGPSNNIEIGARVPILRMNVKNAGRSRSNLSLGDLLLLVRADLSGEKVKKLRTVMGIGIKLPTGVYEDEDLPTGTGTIDFPCFIYSSCHLRTLKLHGDIGYVWTGRNRSAYYERENPGNVLSGDMALVREIIPSVSLVMELNGYWATPSRNYEGAKTDNGQYRLMVHPGIMISIPGSPVKVEWGVSSALLGKNTLCGTHILFRMKLIEP